MSLGEDRVRVKFNPSDISLVGEIKQQTAKLIDMCEAEKLAHPLSNEETRLWALAQTSFEEAAMWAVKAATAPKT